MSGPLDDPIKDLVYRVLGNTISIFLAGLGLLLVHNLLVEHRIKSARQEMETEMKSALKKAISDPWKKSGTSEK